MSTYSARILADSVNPRGVRLITVEATYPAIVHEHLLTHRAFGRCTGSLRAVPVAKMIAAVREHPYVPDAFGENRPGMVAGDDLPPEKQEIARRMWLAAARSACDQAEAMAAAGVHKQWANRLLGPFSWRTVIITATDWGNFFNLRCHPDAQPEIRRAAETMRTAIDASTPRPLAVGDWHLPLITEEDGPADILPWVSAARCARVSYLTHAVRRDLSEDLTLAHKLHTAGHMSPFEHAARAEGDTNYRGNLRGFTQLRKMIPGEAVYGG